MQGRTGAALGNRVNKQGWCGSSKRLGCPLVPTEDVIGWQGTETHLQDEQ